MWVGVERGFAGVKFSGSIKENGSKSNTDKKIKKITKFLLRSFTEK
jgi:hypothetical protein